MITERPEISYKEGQRKKSGKDILRLAKVA
jgi:hypothetical protein